MMNRVKTKYAAIAVLVAVSALVLYLLFARRGAGGLYRVTVLPSLGGDQMVPTAVNDRGEVVGIGQTKDGQWHAFRWDREHGLRDLGPLGRMERRFDINNAGWIAGSMTDPNGNLQAFLSEPGKGRTFLGTLGGRNSRARGINNRGQIVGISETSNGVDHAFLWDPVQGMRDLGTLGGTESQAWAINDAGVVFGLADTPTLPTHPFIWDANDGMLTAGLPPDAAPLNGINGGSWVVGVTASPRRGSHMALWRKGAGVRELFPLRDFVPDRFLLNDANQVVFHEMAESRLPRVLRRFLRPRYRPCLWDPTRGRIRLAPYVPVSARGRFFAQDLNNQGWIVGFVIEDLKASSPDRAVLLEPIPERWARMKPSRNSGEDR